MEESTRIELLGTSVVDIQDMMPGQVYEQRPYVKNVDIDEARVRMGLEVTATLEDGKAVPVERGMITTSDFSTGNWTEGEDGFYYYNRTLRKGETTVELFSGIKLAEEMSNEYQNATFTVKIIAEATQVGGDDWWCPVWIVIFLLISAVVFFVIKRRRRNER